MLPLKGEEHIVIPKKYYLEEMISGRDFLVSVERLPTLRVVIAGCRWWHREVFGAAKTVEVTIEAANHRGAMYASLYEG